MNDETDEICLKMVFILTLYSQNFNIIKRVLFSKEFQSFFYLRKLIIKHETVVIRRKRFTGFF